MIRRQARPFSVVMPEIRSELALGLPRCTRSEKEIAMRLKPIPLVVTLALVILTAPLAADAQPLRKIPRIGYLGAPGPHVEALRQGLHDLGYVEGQNLII